MRAREWGGRGIEFALSNEIILSAGGDDVVVVYERRHELIKYCNLIGLEVTSFSWISEQMNISTWSMREFNLVVGVGRGAGRAVTRYNTPDHPNRKQNHLQ